MRQVVLDTETTGLDPGQGHRIIEIGCVEIENRRLTGRHFQYYINPQRDIDEAAIEVHGITNEFLADKPDFHQIAGEFIEFIRGAELIIHNAPFDIGFLDSELERISLDVKDIASCCGIIDSLVIARKKHPGQRNSLDALCKRYFVDNSQRDLHGALLDAEILADVYLAMTGGQTSLLLGAEEAEIVRSQNTEKVIDANRAALKVIKATEAELVAHEELLVNIQKASDNSCLWLQLAENKD